MRKISLVSDRYLTRLSNLTNHIFDTEFLNFLYKFKERIITDELIPSIHGTSDEYLGLVFKEHLYNYGYPRRSLGINLQFDEASSELRSNLLYQKFIIKHSRLANALGAQYRALSVIYPDDGYIGWHHNGNAAGYNVLFTYSQDGDGWFKYWDYDTKSIKVIQDDPGWNVKVGYYPSQFDEPQRVYWHAARTTKTRISFGFIINQRDMWINAIDEITEGKYDRNFVLNQGPLKDLPT